MFRSWNIWPSEPNLWWQWMFRAAVVNICLALSGYIATIRRSPQAMNTSPALTLPSTISLPQPMPSTVWCLKSNITTSSCRLAVEQKSCHPNLTATGRKFSS
ncbi:hypothetical protein EDD22DRAFT_174523 [Suillus occidentalis]|nr:hypothetical protein EDD22DRAFT_174523 [Suillus occidentalis]